MQKSLSHLLMEIEKDLGTEELTIQSLINQVGSRGTAILLLILAFPAALPLPAPGYATPFGIVISFIGWQLLRGQDTLQLPNRIASRKLSPSLISFSITNGKIPLKAVEFFIRPRLQNLAQNKTMYRLMGGIIMLLAMMMTLPIPLTNTAPSFVIFMLAAGILEEDGLAMIGGILLAPIAVLIAGAAIYYALTYGPEAVESVLKPMIKGLLKGS